MTFKRSGVIDSASMITSNLPAARPAIMPSQSCAMNLQSIFARAQRSLASSGSKPSIVPSGLVRFHGS